VRAHRKPAISRVMSYSRHEDHAGDAAIPADSALPGWLSRLPPRWQPYAMLARLDRPVGIWLLYLPCVMGIALARIPDGLRWADLAWLVLFFLGAVAMRGAGCTWNDITDREIDRRVARTASRPIPSGAVSVRQALLFLLAQLGAACLVWLLLPSGAKVAALLALPLVAIYPFTKRITWWPQAWLGLTFNWGVFVGAAAAGQISGPSYVLYAGLVLWTIAYDTIYALQDREDDALIGVRSTARLFKNRAVLYAFAFHTGAAALAAFAAWLQGAGRLGALAALCFLMQGAWQAWTLSSKGEGRALAMFRANVPAGAILAAGLLASAALTSLQAPRSLFLDGAPPPGAAEDTPAPGAS
jgi:4-hydroxybenzoate polyprenyltransferase